MPSISAHEISRAVPPQKESPAVRATGLVTKTSRKETVLPVGADCQTVTGTSPEESPDRSSANLLTMSLVARELIGLSD